MWEGNTWETNILHKEKLSLLPYNAGKKSYSILCLEKVAWEKKFAQTKSLKYRPLPPSSKVECSTP